MPIWIEKILIAIVSQYIVPALAEAAKKILDPTQISELVKDAEKWIICAAKAKAAGTAPSWVSGLIDELAKALGIDPSCPVP